MPKLLNDETKRKQSITLSLPLDTIILIKTLARDHDRSGSWIVDKAVHLLYKKITNDPI